MKVLRFAEKTLGLPMFIKIYPWKLFRFTVVLQLILHFGFVCETVLDGSHRLHKVKFKK